MLNALEKSPKASKIFARNLFYIIKWQKCSIMTQSSYFVLKEHFTENILVWIQTSKRDQKWLFRIFI